MAARQPDTSRSPNHRTGFDTYPRNQGPQLKLKGIKKDNIVQTDLARLGSSYRVGLVYGIFPSVAPDSKRIAALMPVETKEGQQAQNHVIFLENFFDELRRKVPLSGK